MLNQFFLLLRAVRSPDMRFFQPSWGKKIAMCLAMCGALTACSSKTAETAVNNTQSQEPRIVLNEPASSRCALAGGEPRLAHQLDGSQIKTCQFPNGKRCNESLLMQGMCNIQYAINRRSN